MKVCERVVGWCAVWSKLCCPIIRRSIVLSGYVHGLRIDCFFGLCDGWPMGSVILVVGVLVGW